MKKPMRLTRELVNLIAATVDDPGESEREAALEQGNCYETTTKDILARLPDDGELWVFAIGSLIWKPRFEHVERRVARLMGWQRSFCLGPDTRYRGNPDAPGLMLSLDIGGHCDGVVFRLKKETQAADLLALLEVEPPIPPVWGDAKTEDGNVRCIAFNLPRDSVAYVGGLNHNEVADLLSIAVGKFGSMPDYLLNTIEHLEECGIHDPYLWEMQELVAERLEAMKV